MAEPQPRHGVLMSTPVHIGTPVAMGQGQFGPVGWEGFLPAVYKLLVSNSHIESVKVTYTEEWVAEQGSPFAHVYTVERTP